MLANFTGRSEATRWIQSQTVDIVLVTSEEFLSVGTFVHYNTNTSTVVNKLSVVRVSEIVPGVVASDTEHVVQLERGIRRVAIRRTLPVRIRHLSVDYSAQVDHGLITFTKLFLLKITAVLSGQNELASVGQVQAGSDWPRSSGQAALYSRTDPQVINRIAPLG